MPLFNITRKSLLLAITVVIAIGCTSAMRDFEQFNSPKGGNWSISEPIRFTYLNRDTSSLKTMELILRNTSAYPYIGFSGTVEILSPDNKLWSNSIAIKSLSNTKDKNISNHESVILNGLIFKKKGYYQISIRQTISPILNGVSAVGIAIDKSN